MITLESTLKELYQTPLGHDVLNRLALAKGISTSYFTNRVTGSLKLKHLQKLTKKTLDLNAIEALLEVVNREAEAIDVDGEMEKAWWKEAVFYQIYPMSFADSNNDGIGDIPGIIDRLDYLKDLGVDALWLSPLYDSPNDDNGYDIRDYLKIHEDYGTMADFDALLEAAHKRGMKIVMDLVVNHTSDEHQWFQQAIADPKSKYRDYYFIKEKTDENPPNNWTSFFSGSAWNDYGDAWALHLFSKKQMDLNWDNPSLRQDIIDMINFYLDKGVDGFRMDVINLISKDEGLPDGDPMVAHLMGLQGIEHYVYGPHLHTYLKELHDKAFGPHQAVTIGETPGFGMGMAQSVCASSRKELDMIFTFDHLESPGHTRFEDYVYDLEYYRDFVDEWMSDYGNQCWMSLFYNNHDNPKMASKIDPQGEHTFAIQKLLAVMQMTMKGTPFIFQGEEMGLLNYDFHSMADIKDVESRNLYQELIQTMSEEEAFAIIKAGTRDHARQLLPWNQGSQEALKDLYQKENPEMIAFYKKMIALRHQNPVLVYGDYACLNKKKHHYVYSREDDHHLFIVDCNLSAKPQKAYEVPSHALLVEPYYLPPDDQETLAAYEVRLYHVKKD